MNEHSLLNVENLTKVFPGATHPSVDHISFSLFEGEILGILGPNGAGKTTTLQMVLGTLTTTSGSINYFGKDLAKHRSEILQKVGFATTYVGLPGLLTVYENLTIFGYLAGIAQPERQVKEMIELFNLEKIMYARAGSLSTGQLARVMLAKAFLPRPRIVILDEPTAALDPNISHGLRHLILKMQHEYKMSILFTSHNMEEVTEICDRVIVLKQGKIIANDAPENLAKTVSKARLQLIVTEGAELLYAYAHKNNLVIVATDRFIEIEVEEADVAKMLASLGRAGVQYSHIAIEKPTLEDYFLHIAQG